jgi:hypothetical protein
LTDPPSSATRCELAAIGDTNAELVLALFATPETPLWQFVFPREPVLCQSCASPGLPEQRCPCAGSLLSGRKTTSQCLRCRACLQIVQLRGLPKNLLALTRRNDAKANPGCLCGAKRLRHQPLRFVDTDLARIAQHAANRGWGVDPWPHRRNA